MTNPKQLGIKGLMLLEESILTILFTEPDLKPEEISKQRCY